MTFNVLAVFAHPNNHQSFNAGLLDCTKEAYRKAGAALTLTHYSIFAVDDEQREQMKQDTHDFILQALSD